MTMPSESSNERRLAALWRRKEEAAKAQAAVSAQLRAPVASSTRLVFGDDGDEAPKAKRARLSAKGGKPKPKAKAQLFEEAEDDEDPAAGFAKPQFDGAKGGELLELQASYGGDARFNLDRRFAQGEKGKAKKGSSREEAEEGGQGDGEEDVAEERTEQLRVLQKLLGKAVRSDAVGPKAPPTAAGPPQPKGLRRFDPRQPQHHKYLKPAPEPVEEAEEEEEEYEEEEPEEEAPEAQPEERRVKEVKPSVAMDDGFAERLRRKQRGEETEAQPFSLLAALGRPATGVEVEEPVKETKASQPSAKASSFLQDDFLPFSEQPEEDTPKKKKKKAKAPAAPVPSERFFFSPDDERLAAVAFGRGKRSAEAVERSWAKYRPSLVKSWRRQRKAALARIQKAHRLSNRRKKEKKGA